VMAAQERGESLARWRARLEQALGVTAKLVEAGEAAGYDRRRLEREVQAARLRAEASEADAARSREILAGWMELPAGELRINASLVPAGVPPLETLAAGVDARPDVAALEAQAGAFDSERRAAERAWIPDLTVGAGQKRVEESGRSDSGLLLSFSVPLPLFDRGRAAAAQARSNADAARAERELRLAHARRQLRGTWQQARALREAAERAAGDGIAGSRELSRIAETAYRGGEASLLELLDAYRAELEAETSALDLALRARMARIELDTLSGTH
jgi:outer membrane protein, heavy metal efflux system